MYEKLWLSSCHPDNMIQWLSYYDRQQMARQHEIRPRYLFSHRKARLYGCACLRLVWHLLPGERTRQAIDLTEKYIDGLCRDQQVQIGEHDYSLQTTDRSSARARARANSDARMVAWKLFHPAGYVWRTLPKDGLRPADQARVLREIIGNPFRTIRFAKSNRDHLHTDFICLTCGPFALSVFGNDIRCPRCGKNDTLRERNVLDDWLNANDATALRLAQAIHVERAFDRMPILADALEDVGCNSPELLSHLRGSELGYVGNELNYVSNEASMVATLVERKVNHVAGCWALDLILGKE